MRSRKDLRVICH